MAGIARLVRAVDFERVLKNRSRLNSAHFAVHHVADRPTKPARPAPTAAGEKLSTGDAPGSQQLVDDLPAPVLSGVWLGAVVPKRHARRAVTRTLLKRQIRSVVAGHESSLGAGLWVVRLRAPFDRARFVSAASDALRLAARAELEQLIVTACVAASRR
jgi:ribonuclease P protein component